MKRHAKTLQAKAKENEVTYLGRGKWNVKSATSDNDYMVTALREGYTCTCQWKSYPNNRFRPCSHTMSVMAWQEQQDGRRASFWANEEDARRQHHTKTRIGLGLRMTTRKARG